MKDNVNRNSHSENLSYTSEKHTRILIALLKEHGIKKIIISPGGSNVCFVGSVQSDPFFEIYSSVDERSAAFIAVGLAAESGEPVALSCTGSTASRNYIPGLTEAFYRKLPVLAITATQPLGRVGQYYNQVIDRSSPLADIALVSVNVPCVFSEEDEWACALNINKAIIALRKNGGGPAHINLVATGSSDFSFRQLPKIKMIKHIEKYNDMPSLEHFERIAILVGVHSKWTKSLSDNVEKFCEIYNAVVIRNHASNYKGDYGYNPDLINNMFQYSPKTELADLVISIGGVSRYNSGMQEKEMWRVNPDGEIRDFEKKLTYVFEMSEEDFFQYYIDCAQNDSTRNDTYALKWQNEYSDILSLIPKLPFCNVWIAKKMCPLLPSNSVFHLAGANTARAWNFFEIPKTVDCFSNDGTMGIDGQVSAMIGESLAAPKKIHIGVVGDLTFFYDMNCLGNRHIRNNFRLMIINNGVGAEFKIYSHLAYKFGDLADKYIAARGHYGNKSLELVRHYAEDLGFEYLAASTKEEFQNKVMRFVTPKLTERPMVFEVFTDSSDESDGIYAMNHIVSNASGKAKAIAKDVIKSIVGEKGISAVKNLLKK